VEQRHLRQQAGRPGRRVFVHDRQRRARSAGCPPTHDDTHAPPASTKAARMERIRNRDMA
jgi:hypothetical protein